MPLTTLGRPWPWLGVALALLVGCQPAEEVRTYTAPHEPVAELPPPPLPPGADRSRLLGVIIPVGPGSSRFVKFSGAIDKVTAVEAKFNEFVAGLRLPDPAAPPTFTVPAGWTENPPRELVANSFTVGPAGTPHVTLSPPFGGTLLANVNRWRGEVGLPEVIEADLPKSVVEISLGSTKAYKVDFRGPAAPSSGAARMRLPGVK